LAEYAGWAVEDLLAEIKREEEELESKRTDLRAAEERRAELEKAIITERLPQIEERTRTRAALITALTEFLAEQEAQVHRYQDRLKERQAEIDRVTTRIRELEASLPRVSPVERFIRRGVIASLRRSLSSLRGWLTRDTNRIRTLQREVRSNRSRLAAFSGWQTREWRLVSRLRELEDAIREASRTISELQTQIAEEEEELKRKYEALPKLFRVKIRLYAVKERRNYYLTFQGFFDVDAILDPSTGLPVWDWWLTKQEIQIAKYHFHGYWKGGVGKPKPFDVEEIGQAYLTDYMGTSTPEHLEKPTEFKYTKDVPEEYKRLAATITLRETIIGLSNIKPRQVKDPDTEMGVFFEYAMIIDENGYIKWMERRDRWAWKPSKEIIDRVKKELGL